MISAKPFLRSSVLLAALAALAPCAARADITNDPTNFGALPGTSISFALNVTDDGIAAGWSYAANLSYGRGVRMIPGGGMQDLGTLGTGTRSLATYISDDGNVVIGASYLAGSSGTIHAFRWTEATGMQDLGSLGATGSTSSHYGMSRDGNVVIGTYYLSGSSGAYRSFRWTEATGMQDLGSLGGPLHFPVRCPPTEALSQEMQKTHPTSIAHFAGRKKVEWSIWALLAGRNPGRKT